MKGVIHALSIVQTHFDNEREFLEKENKSRNHENGDPAPCVNLLMPITNSVHNVTKAPNPLITAFNSQPFSLSLTQ